VKPNETFETDKTPSLRLPYRTKDLVPGDYFLRVTFSAWWPEAFDTREKLKTKWKRYGDLYTDELVPDPVAVHVDFPQPAPSCGDTH
jgi:hypothetical protein